MPLRDSRCWIDYTKRASKIVRALGARSRASAISPNGGYGILAPTAASVRLDVGGPDHLAPLLGFVGDELAEFGGRHRHRHAAQIGEPRLDRGIGEAGVNCLVELVDD